MLRVKRQPKNALQKQSSSYAALVQQYIAQNLLAHIAKRIDDLHYENFHVPELLYQERVLCSVNGKQQHNAGRVYAESDYVDAQEQLEYKTPNWAFCENLSAQNVQQLKCINVAVSAATNNKTITLAQLRRALTAQQLQQFTQSLTEVQHESEIKYGDGMPMQLSAYNKKMNKADFAWYRYEALPSAQRYGAKRKAGSAGRMEDKAISLYEDALECLADIVGGHDGSVYGNVQIWMDRVVDFNAGTFRNIDHQDPISMPRVRGSKSRYAESSGLPKLHKRIKHQYCALLALLVAGCELAFVLPVVQEEEMTADQTAKLREMLRKIK